MELIYNSSTFTSVVDSEQQLQNIENPSPKQNLDLESPRRSQNTKAASSSNAAENPVHFFFLPLLSNWICFLASGR